MNLRTPLFLFLFLIMPLFSAHSARLESIAAVVNEDVVTASDVEDRLKLIVSSSGLTGNQDIIQKLMPQVVETLIDEQLMLQEARRYEVEVSEEEIDNGFAILAKQNNADSVQFAKMVKSAGVNVNTMRRQIKAQLSWNKVVQRVLRPKVNITENDVEAYLQQVNNAMGKTEFLTAEIFLPVDDAKKEANAKQLAQRLIGEMNSGKTPFSKVAQQFSQAAGASNGGDLGWVREGQLPEELDSALTKLKKGQLSKPIRSLGGYHIFFVRDTRKITEESVPEVQAIRNAIGLDRLDKLQRRYLLDLKAEAFIENRAGS